MTRKEINLRLNQLEAEIQQAWKLPADTYAESSVKRQAVKKACLEMSQLCDVIPSDLPMPAEDRKLLGEIESMWPEELFGELEARGFL